MELVKIVFYFFALLTVASGLFILFTRNILHAAFSLLATFLGLAGLYVIAGADYVAITQIVVYVGGVLVLIIFGVILSKRIAGSKFAITQNHNVYLGGTVFLLIAVLSFFIYKNTRFDEISWIANARVQGTTIKESTITTIGYKLMTDYVLAFELAAVILLVALIGAAFIAGRVMKNVDKS